MLNVLLRSKKRRLAAGRIYEAVVTRAREPVFFERFAVADTLDGRFDLFTLHAWLVLERLKACEPSLSQAVVDAVFVGFDEALRDLGAGDMGMGRRMKKMADAFYGRVQAYGAAGDAAAMEAALVRNLYRGEAPPCARRMADYVLNAKTILAAWEEGPPDFGPLPEE
jgi:cytochrome b pre-mRNA-processing protein 3